MIKNNGNDQKERINICARCDRSFLCSRKTNVCADCIGKLQPSLFEIFNDSTAVLFDVQDSDTARQKQRQK